MADFSHVAKQQALKETAEFTFYEIPGEPALTVRYAGESNKPYFNEVLRRAEHLQRRKAKLNVDMIRDNRERDRDLYPKHVVTGWKNVKDKNGAEVGFNQEDCLGFLRALPDDMFDELRQFCRDPHQFREIADGAAAAGNSPTV